MCNRRARFKKIIAAVLSLAMVVGSSTVTFAEGVEPGTSPTISSKQAEGNVEAWVEKNIFRVEVPTVSDNTFAMILDPQGLINATNQAAYTGKTFESNQNVFFARTSGNETGIQDYMHKSDIISVNNTGSVSINVAVQVSVNDADGIKFVNTNTFADNTDKMAKMYLAVIPTPDGGSAGTPVAVSNNKAATISENVGFDEGNFTVSYNATTDKYFLSENATPTWKSMKFQLEAGINKYGDFADLNAPKVDVVWTIKDASGPKIRISKDGLIVISNLTADRNLRYTGTFAEDSFGSKLGGVAIYNVDKNQFAYTLASETWDNSGWSAESGGTSKVQLGSGWMTNWSGDEVYARVFLTDNTTVDSVHVQW